MSAKKIKHTIVTHINRPYKFGQYDSNWSKEFEENSKVIKKIFGNNVVVLEHIGSTSIPGMWAKPQIDILVTVKNLDKIPEFYEQMRNEGFCAHGDYTKEGEEYFTKDTKEGIRKVGVHVLPKGHSWSVDLLDFRDYLRCHPRELEFYSNIKRNVNAKYPTDYTKYYKEKLKSILQLRKRAAAWRGHKLQN